MKNNGLYKLEKKDLDQGAEVLVKSFYDYPMFKYILGEKYNEENAKAVFKFLVKYAILYGEAYASSSEVEGVILFSDYKDYNFTLFRSLRAGALSLFKLGTDAGKKFEQFDQFCSKIHERIIKEPHQYLILLGVAPKNQGQGIGSKLMLPFLKVAERKDHPCYLETHKFENIAIYKSYGFEVVSEDMVPGTDIVQWSMLKGK
ncbi:GNAT family N-acetyltransferase [Natroniella sp. ANB-PHB2]|uniref:GNAT family N-acetyltransferase n=1 Tax=Natroniella sp. ANB-PHB2 TaxID=3384444 RepID=UPI0038D39A5A